TIPLSAFTPIFAARWSTPCSRMPLLGLSPLVSGTIGSSGGCTRNHGGNECTIWRRWTTFPFRRSCCSAWSTLWKT
ncbi:ORFL189W.iORF1, partial [Human betaherpesvirus 5]